MYGQFTPTTPNMKNQFGNNANTYSNFTESFSTNKPLINAQDFRNKRDTLHDNIGKDLQTERVVDYKIQINSIDRNPQMTPNPFDIRVSMGNSKNSFPNIKRKFENIKYITLNSVILPRTIAIDTSKINPDTTGPPPYDIYPTCSPIVIPHPEKPNSILHNLEHHPYLYLRIKEIGTNNNIGSNPLLEYDTFMIVPDQKLGDMYLWKAIKGAATLSVYPNSKYENISQLSLSILDENGNVLTVYDQTGKNIIRRPLGSEVQEDFNEYVEKYKNNNDLVKYTDNVTQVIYHFTFGVVENELNTLPKFD